MGTVRPAPARRLQCLCLHLSVAARRRNLAPPSLGPTSPFQASHQTFQYHCRRQQTPTHLHLGIHPWRHCDSRPVSRCCPAPLFVSSSACPSRLCCRCNRDQTSLCQSWNQRLLAHARSLRSHTPSYAVIPSVPFPAWFPHQEAQERPARANMLRSLCPPP